MKTAGDFSTRVVSYLKKIPRGKVATYGQIAALAGKPHGARGVAWILHSSSGKHKLPWQRVLNSKGKISFPRLSAQYLRQKKLLRDEGVIFEDHDDAIDMTRFQWHRRAPLRRGW